MKPSGSRKMRILFLLLVGALLFSSSITRAATTPTMIIEEAKFAIDQARRAGADKVALDDLLHLLDGHVYRAYIVRIRPFSKEYP